VGARRQLDRQAEHEPRAARGRVERQAAAEALGQLAADRQAEAEPARAARGAAAAEALEDLLALALRDPRALVGDGERRVLAVVGGLHADRRARRAVAQGVVDEDADHARHGVRIPLGPAGAARRHEAQAAPAVAVLQRELGGHRARDLPELHGLRAQGDAGVQAREVQELRGQVAQAARAPAGPWRPGGRASSWSRSPSGQVLPEQLERARAAT
jgi:hypothetical protein